MNVAYIYDAVRTPRGRGKSDGSLHDIQPVSLAQQVLEQLRDRNHLDTSLIDDVIMGCVTPIGEQGADIARTAVIAAGYDQRVAGVHARHAQERSRRVRSGGQEHRCQV